MKKDIVKIVLLGISAILLTSIIVINNLKNEEETSFVDNNEETSSIDNTSESPNETIKIEELFKNIDDYVEKKVTVVGYAPWELGNVDDVSSHNAIYSNDWQNELFIDNVDEVIAGGYEVTVIGKIYKKEDNIHIATEEYKINTEVVRGEDESTNSKLTESNVNTKSTFALMREAAEGYANMNWNQLMKNPTSLAKTFVYIPGKVVDMQVSYGITSGLIDTQGVGNMNDLVSFEIKGEVYDFKEGDIIAPMGYIDSSTGFATNSTTNQVVNTPKIIVSDPTLWKVEYYLNQEDNEIKKFMYGTYKVVNENDIDEGLGKEFEFSSSSIGGHDYQYQKKVYLNPAIKIGSGTLMRGYDNIGISMSLTAEGIGTQGANSGLTTTTVSIPLNGSPISVNSDGGHVSKYAKSQ